MISIYAPETIIFKEKPYLTLLIELPNDKYTRIGGESLEKALMNKDHTDYVSPLAQFFDEGIDCYIPNKILDSGDTEAIEKAIREVDPELFDDEPEEEPEELTWDDIYKAADGCACGEPNLQRKDFARGEIVDWFEENFGINLEREGEENVIEIVEEALDDCAERYNLVFDREGHIIGCSEVTIQDKASELVSFYDKRPDRPDKDFDTLDIALNILRTITDNPNELKSAAPKSPAAKSNKERVLEAVRNFVDAYDKAEEAFSEYPGDINDLISEEYPFEKSFDEYGCRMQVWEGKVKDAVFHKTIEENLSKEEARTSDTEIERNYSSIEELRTDEELQNMSRYEYKKVILDGKPVFACTTNQQYEDILWSGVNDALRKFEDHFGLTGEDILDVDDFSSEIRDIILDRYEKRGIRLVDVFENY